MPRLLAGLLRLPDIVAAALLAVLTLLIAAQVLVRYALGGSLVWSEELTRLLFVWLILVAATTAPPMRVDIFIDLLSPRWRALARLFSDLVVLALTLVLLYGAWGMMDLMQFDTYTALGISLRWLYLALFVGALLWLLRSFGTLGRNLQDLLP